ncbi:MAG: hypothetical protein SNJ59_02635 [Aggregatilineales bacterium]
MGDILRLAWERFSIVAAIVGDYQGRFITNVFFYTILPPFGIGARLFSDPLGRKRSQPSWLEREPVDNQLEAAKRQG